MTDSSRPGGKHSRKDRPLPTTDELRDLVDRFCRRQEEEAGRTIDSYGKRLGPVVRQMLEEDLDVHDETRGKFAVWFVGELMIFDLLNHPDGLVLVNWFGLPPYPSCSEDGPEKSWYVASQTLAEALTMEQIAELFLHALLNSCDEVRQRAERAWKDICRISGSDYNLRGTTLRRQFEKYRDRLVEELKLIVQEEELEVRDAAERTLAIVQEDGELNRLFSS